MDLKIEELTQEVMDAKEEEFFGFVQSSLVPQRSIEREKNIIKRIRMDVVIKDYTEFAVHGITKGLFGVLDTMVCLTDEDEKPKRSY